MVIVIVIVFVIAIDIDIDIVIVIVIVVVMMIGIGITFFMLPKRLLKDLCLRPPLSLHVLSLSLQILSLSLPLLAFTQSGTSLGVQILPHTCQLLRSHFILLPHLIDH